jgi:hypothetical protein
MKLEKSIHEAYKQAISYANPETLRDFLFWVDSEFLINIEYHQDMTDSEIFWEASNIKESYFIQADLLVKLIQMIGEEC